MSKLKAKVYIPTKKNHRGEQYDSFEEMIEARPDCKTDLNAGPQIPYHCEYPENEKAVV
ncbi:hypothetical protein [Methanococcoides sp. FTZ1]|uniref:hypothetical protein n=1 Tax=Methanococcoides sp. FTZ1 TaxID=3439061 RepID=UPI003F8417CA